MRVFSRILTIFGVVWIFGGVLSLISGSALGLATIGLGAGAMIWGTLIRAGLRDKKPPA